MCESDVYGACRGVLQKLVWGCLIKKSFVEFIRQLKILNPFRNLFKDSPRKCSKVSFRKSCMDSLTNMYSQICLQKFFQKILQNLYRDSFRNCPNVFRKSSLNFYQSCPINCFRNTCTYFRNLFLKFSKSSQP